MIWERYTKSRHEQIQNAIKECEDGTTDETSN